MIYETIITSVNKKGEAHVTPFGVRYEHNDLVISPFKPSKTLDNILQTQSAVMNLTDDVRVFAGALTNQQSWTLVPTEHVKGFRLEHCLRYVELTLKNVRDDAQRPQLIMQPIATNQVDEFLGFNRAQAAVVELAVLTSRLHLLPPSKIKTEMEYLQIAIDKTAGPQELEAWGWLTDKIQDYYRTQQP